MDDVLRGLRSIHTVALLGNHLPRRCGIATFTTDLADALDVIPDVETVVVAMNAPGEQHRYPPRVQCEVSQGDLESYRHGADFLNNNRIDVVSVQHEYGIFGGKSGGHLLELLRALRMPVITTLHTVLEAPSPEQREVLETIAALSRRLVVMSDDAAALLARVHHVDPSKIDVIPHGIPGVPPGASKELLGLEERPVILTFGLLSPDKGIEYVIEAMPAVVDRHPTALYVVLGATHPHVRAQQGEAYRQRLVSLAERLGVTEHVTFDNRFVSRDELMHFLGAADLYVTPYLNEAQSTSGTLAYALGAGKAVISTPYRYARELLADGRGVLVPWRDAAAISRALNELIEDVPRRLEMQQRAARLGEAMSWPLVAQRYVQTFERAVADGARRRGLVTRRSPELPELDLSHLRLMTDSTGLLQHASFDVPRLSDGYCVDDNARALQLMAHLEEEASEAQVAVRPLATRYLAFLTYAFEPLTGRFKNFLGYDRAWRDEPGSEDAHGRALWALGTVVGRTSDQGRRSLCNDLFRAALPRASSFISPRAWAYALLGIDEFFRAFPVEPHATAMLQDLSHRLLERFDRSSSDMWLWFEDRLTYCNARLPHGLLVASARLSNSRMRDVALHTLDWLMAQQLTDDGTFSPIGSGGFYTRGGPRALFDQQPVEAYAAVSACLDAYRLTRQTRWLGRARSAFQWFLGNNALQVPVYDASTGGCRDGVHVDRLNENQGAESTLSFLAALVDLRAADRHAAAHRPSFELSIALPLGASDR
jgi:glycosyltransferase involved in cell wall biosynthesis